MKLLQFAVASVVDANTGYGLVHNGGRVDYTAAARHGRTIRAKSIVALYRLIKDQVSSVFSSYRARVEKNRQIATLAKLDDRLLKDIGLSREDIYAVRSGAASVEQLQSERRNDSQNGHSGVLTTTRVGQQTLQLDAVNEADYVGAKCA